MKTKRPKRKEETLPGVGSTGLFGIYGGYEIALSNGRGGKAGTGHNKTATIQVREPVRPGEYLLKAQFHYDVASNAAKANAHAKARVWIDAQRLKTKMPNDRTELLECPFCGKLPEMKYGQFYEAPFERWSVYCRCLMHVQTNWVDTRENAAELWNRRAL